MLKSQDNFSYSPNVFNTLSLSIKSRSIASGIPQLSLIINSERTFDNSSRISETEERWLSLGQAENSTLLMVIHIYQEINAYEANVRIISARPATKHEQHQYEARL